MKLSRILENTTVKDSVNMYDADITNISSDSRKIRENGLFFAKNGYLRNGFDFIPAAVENGAAAVVVEKSADLSSVMISKNIPVISLSEDISHALATASCNLNDHPSKKLKLIGITGTKGKTTSSFMLKAILEAHGLKVGLIGSIAVYIGDKQVEITDRTTPESYSIQQTLAKMVEENCDVAIIEVSSQAMKLSRVTGCEFDVALFTNFSEDHISPHEHKDMEDYFNAKMELMKLTPNIVVNTDNEYTAKVPSLLPDKNITTFGMGRESCDVSAKELKPSNAFVDFTLCMDGEEGPVRVSMPTIMIDYAHTPASLESILKTVKPYTKGRVICTWGVGGDRDRTKRPVMGEISGRLADFTILTSDQIRTEDPMRILKDIETGLKKVTDNYTIILNRTEAIRYAISMATKDDLIVLPGLGNDLYIEYNGVKYPYNEREVIRDAIEEIIQKKHLCIDEHQM